MAIRTTISRRVILRSELTGPRNAAKYKVINLEDISPLEEDWPKVCGDCDRYDKNFGKCPLLGAVEKNGSCNKWCKRIE